VAILDEKKGIVGNVSLRDVRSLLSSGGILAEGPADDFRRVLLPAGDFIKVVRADALVTSLPAITCHEGDTLGLAIAKLKATNLQ
jgi:hypothetical protein